MIFGTIVFVLLLGIAFFHYVQGLFSAMISATLVVLAAILAVSYHESIAESLFANAFPTYAHAVALVGLFALSYVVMRLVADRIVPGNVRLPVLVDKIGAGVFGFIAGLFATGVLAIAAQLLPLGPDIAGYSRFSLDNREVSNVKVAGKYQRQDVTISGELKENTFSPTQASALYPVPTDSTTLGIVQYVSNGGSLAGERPLNSIHPEYLNELFGHRLGPLLGADVLIAKGGNLGIAVGDAYSTEQVLDKPQDFELKVIREDRTPQLTAEGTIPVVLRTTIEPPTAAGGNAFNMGSIRLVVNGRDYYPIGSYQHGQKLFMTRLDDYLFTDGRNPVDLVFMVDSDMLPPAAGSDQRTFPPGSFIEAKRAARMSLAGKAVGTSVPADSSKVGIVEKDKNSQQ